MKMNLWEAIDMMYRGETPEEWARRQRRIRRYANERDELEDCIAVLESDCQTERDRARLVQKRERLQTVYQRIEELTERPGPVIIERK